MTQFNKDDLNLLQDALGQSSTVASNKKLEKISNFWDYKTVKSETKNVNGQEVFDLINQTNGDAWVETTDAIFIRHVEIDGKAWWNISEFLRDTSADISAYDKLPNNYNILSAQIVKDDKTSLHITHIHGQEYQVEEIKEGEGDGALVKEDRFLGVSNSDNNYEIIYKTYWVNDRELPRQYCSRFSGFISIKKEKNND